MFALGLVLNIIGIGVFCWAIFSLTVYALPLFVAANVGLATFNGGAGVVGALLVGSAAAGLTLISGQLAFAAARSVLLRGIVAAIFLVPAGIAGHHGALALSQLVVPSPLWREAFAWVGVVFICGAAWTRLAVFSVPCPSPGSAERGQSQPDLATTTGEGLSARLGGVRSQ
jgi:hypothetical protein